MRTEPWLKRHPEAVLTDGELICRTSTSGKGMTHYRIAAIPYIGNGAEKLYSNEKRRDHWINKCAEEMADILGVPPALKWTHLMPEVLAAAVGGFDQPAGLAAAIGLLRREGFEVTIPAEITECADDEEDSEDEDDE